MVAVLSMVALLAAALGVLLWKFQPRYYLAQYLFFTRFPLGTGLLLLVLPALATTVFDEFLGNLFRVGGWELFFITLLSILSAWSVALAFGLIYVSVPRLSGLRFKKANKTGPNSLPSWPDWKGVIVAGSPALSTIVVTSLSCTAGWGWRLLAIASGAGVAALVYRMWIRLSESRRPERLKGADRHFRTIHAVAFAALFLVLYVALGACTGPARDNAVSRHVPPLAFVQILLVSVCLAMSWLSSHMDPYRLPVLVTALLVSAFTYTIFNSDHAYEVRTWEGTPPPLGPAEATKAWIDHHPVDEFPAVVFIAASGGGIKAAVWTSTVLAGLTEDKAIGTKFPRSVVLLSTVSGGTVGAMYFVNAYKDGRPPGPAEARAGVAKAGTSSLSAVAWGLAYPDFWRIVFSPAVPADRDRGWALEERWRIALDDPGQTLSTWRAGIQQGWRPVPIFNATVVETGDRLTISPIDVPQGDRGAGLVRTQKTPRRLDFRDLYPGRDLHVATAARLSATFPWVSSVARPGDRTIPESQRYHVGDGGYFDNDGVVSALEFMDEALGQLYEEPPKRAPRTAVLIRIRASPLSKKAGAKDGDGWVHSLAGPLLAMLNVRTASQTVRDDDEVDRFQAYWECSGVTVRVVSFVLTVDASMSWHLSPEEKDAIESEWRGLAVDADKESPERPGGRDLRELRSLFAKKPR